jgi:hypothetical protein
MIIRESSSPFILSNGRRITMLKQEIEKKRQQLIEIANKFGLTSTKTLQCSKELDKLLDRYQIRQSRLDVSDNKEIC